MPGDESPITTADDRVEDAEMLSAPSATEPEPESLVENEEASEDPPKLTAKEKREKALLQRKIYEEGGDGPSNDTQLLLEAPDPDDPAPSIPSSDSRPSVPSINLMGSSSSDSYGGGYKSSRTVNSLPVGATGLGNLGNTCFMNSALQCLSNTALLTHYFLSDIWKPDLNPDNPLGMSGQVAEAYADLVRHLWKVADNRPSSVQPRLFKSTIGRFNPTFMGYSQQDSQELLQFLLDGLHEDLNRIKQKPYIEAPDMDGQPDEVIAKKSWDIYRARNDSQIVDLFQGEYKSRVECLECGKWSVKFDPFMFLSVPVPERREITKTITAVPGIRIGANNLVTPKPVRLSITLPRDATIQQMKTKVAERMGWESRRILFAEIYEKKLYKLHKDWDRAAEIQDQDDVLAYELLDPDWDAFGTPKENRDFLKTNYIPIYLSAKTEHSYHYTRRDDHLFGYPLMITVPAEVQLELWFRTAELKYTGAGHQNEIGTIFLNALGSILYRQVVRTIRRYTKFGLWKREEDTDINLDALRSDVEALMEEQRDAEDETETDTYRRPLVREPIEPPIPRLACRLQHEEMPDVPVVPLEQLFSLKYYEAGQNESYYTDRENFYSNYHAKTCGQLYPATEVKVKVPIRKKVVADVPIADVQDGGDGEDGGDDDEDKKNDSGIDAKSSSKRMLDLDGLESNDYELAGYEPEELNGDLNHEYDYKFREILLESVPEGTPGAVSDTRDYNMKSNRLLVVAEFDPYVASILFGAKVVKGSKSKVGGFEPQAAEGDVENDDAKSESPRGKTITLQDCLSEFMKEEIMGDEDTWYCPLCKEHRKIKKKLDIWSFPEVGYDTKTHVDNLLQTLVFHLKRFSNTGRGFRSMSANKIDALVDCPLEGLDLTEFIIGKKARVTASSTGDIPAGHAAETTPTTSEPEEEKYLYDLYAVSNHYGGMGGGHYTAYAKNVIDGNWYNFDDSHVSRANENQVMSEAAYLLFYQRRRKKSPVDFEALVEELKKKQADAPPSPPPSKSYFSSSSNFYGSYPSSNTYNYGTSSMTRKPGYIQALNINSPARSGDTSALSSTSDDDSSMMIPGGRQPTSIQSSPGRLQMHTTLKNDAGFEFNPIGYGDHNRSISENDAMREDVHEIRVDQDDDTWSVNNMETGSNDQIMGFVGPRRSDDDEDEFLPSPKESLKDSPILKEVDMEVDGDVPIDSIEDGVFVERD